MLADSLKLSTNTVDTIVVNILSFHRLLKMGDNRSMFFILIRDDYL